MRLVCFGAGITDSGQLAVRAGHCAGSPSGYEPFGMHGCNTTAHIIQPFMTAFLLLNAELCYERAGASLCFYRSVLDRCGNSRRQRSNTGIGQSRGCLRARRILRDASRRTIGSVTFNINELLYLVFRSFNPVG